MSQPFPPNLQNVINHKARDLKFWDNFYHLLCVTCHLSCVMCQVWHARCCFLVERRKKLKKYIYFLFSLNHTWQLTSDTQRLVNIVSKFQVPSSYYLVVKVCWRYFHKGWESFWMNQWITQFFFRTVPAIPGLLMRAVLQAFELRIQNNTNSVDICTTNLTGNLMSNNNIG